MSKNPRVISFERSPDYVHHRAMLNRRENNIVDALELMRSAVEKSPDNPEYKLDLAELYCEMGCHGQSSRLLLDMLMRADGPSECYYGLALNYLGMNDVPAAMKLLRLYARLDPEGARSEEVRQLKAELALYSEMERYGDRKTRRGWRVADRACEAMKLDMPDRACRLFEQSLAMASEQYDMRALYAMALLMRGDAVAARREAERAAEGYPPSARALCVCAQVYGLLDETETAVELVNRAVAAEPENQELRLLVYTMGAVQMHREAADLARLALQDAPFDRDMMHMRAIALKHLGTPDAELAPFWARILRIDPEDSVAQFYLDAARRGELDQSTLDYGYQVPREEIKRRFVALIGELSQGFDHVAAAWSADAGFRRLVRWAVGVEEPHVSRAAMTALATIDTEEARSVLREMMFAGSVPFELKLHAAMVLKLQGVDLEQVLPADMGLAEGMVPDVETMLREMPVGERQLVRYANEVLSRDYGVSALLPLILMWSGYRGQRGTKADPLRCTEGAAAALAYNYLLCCGEKPNLRLLARRFNAPLRQMVYYARRIAGTLEETEDGTSDEDH